MNKRFLLTILLIIGCLTVAAKTRKAVYIIIDGVPADQIERLKPEAIFDIASRGAYSRAYTGGEIGDIPKQQPFLLSVIPICSHLPGSTNTMLEETPT